MTTVAPRAPRAQRAQLLFENYPPSSRLVDSQTFRNVLGRMPVSTFARYLQEGRIRPPVKIGARNMWPETYVAEIAANGTAPAGTF